MSPPICMSRPESARSATMPICISRPGSRLGSKTLKLPGLHHTAQAAGFTRQTTPDKKCPIDLDKWEQQIADKHQVMTAAKAVHLLIEHHNEPLIRVALEIVCDPDARKCLWWQEGWYGEYDKREYWRNLVRSKFEVVADFACPAKTPTVSTLNFESSGVSGDAGFTLEDLDARNDRCLEIMQQEYEREQALYHQREALHELRSRSQHQQAELESLRKLLADRAASPDVSINGDRSGEGEESRPSSRSRNRPSSRNGRPNSRRGGVATRLYKDAMRRADKSDKEEAAKPSTAPGGVLERAKSVENPGNDTPRVRNIVLEGCSGQDDVPRRLNPKQAKRVADASQATHPGAAGRPSNTQSDMLAVPAEVQAARKMLDSASPVALSVPLPVMPSKG